MDPETLVVLGLLAAVTLPLTWTTTKGAGSGARAGALTGWTCGVALLAWAAFAYPAAAVTPPTDRPVPMAHAGYVSSDSCKACHPEHYATWHSSYHRTMTQVATTDTVLGPVDGTVVEARGRVFVLERRGKEVWVEMDDPSFTGTGDAPRVHRQIVQTTGSHEEQFYWTASGQSRKLAILPIMYRLLDEQRWAPLDGCCISPPTSVQEGGTGRWNRVCNRCHATHAVPRLRSMEEMDTHVAELGIACEACHGPGGEHAEHYRDPRVRYAQHKEAGAVHAIVNPGTMTKERSAEACGQCHGIHGFLSDEDRAEWRENGYSFRPGDKLADFKELKVGGDDHFWSDGMVRVSGREYNGLVRTPCFEDGEMTCLSCHVMHQKPDDPRPVEEWANDQLGYGMDGDRACTQCHTEYEDAALVAEHTHHAPGSTGSECLNCHMPHTTYGLLKGIRSHEVSSPSARESVETGRPNACNACHLDKPLAWAADRMAEWYGHEVPRLSRDQRELSAGVLWSTRGDAGQRALIAWAMGWEPAREASGTDWMTPFLTAMMRDPYHAVRYIAHRSFQKQPEAGTIDYDFMIDDHERFLEMTAPAYFAWAREAEARGREASRALLITEQGELDLTELERLLNARDNTPITLNE